jgi:outer membrane receptor protein involved in Fe transport
MTKYNELSGAIRLALLAGSMTLVAAPAFAQDEDDDVEVLTAVQVTGSRIQSQAITASSPVAEIQREEFQFAGATRVDDLVNQYPQLQLAFDSQTNNPSTGYATVDLRGLGPQRTLTLVNGHRLPPGPVAQITDISIIPAALISRVDILTGGASAVYGSDAVAGVVNFVLDTEFEGVSINAGYSAYQHDNDNEYVQDQLSRRNFPFEDGDSGFDGASKNVDIAIGGRFADGAGHAMAWLTWRDNDPLFQGQRDYSSCALNAAGASTSANGACGGSGTAPIPNFYAANSSTFIAARINPDGSFSRGAGAPYNFAPINYYQRPDERFTFGTSIKYEINQHFKPYLETMAINRKDELQIAESGTFFLSLPFACDDPIIGTFCSDLDLDPNDPVSIYLGKRNSEGGPRRQLTEDNTYRFVLGVEGEINDSWSYNASFLRARTSNDTQGFNDFLFSRIESAVRGCPAGSFDGCLPYNIFVPGGVTAEAANALAGVSFNKTNTQLQVLNAYVTGDTGFGFGSADGSTVQLVAGLESRKEEYNTVSDNDSAAGNFAGAGAAAPPVSGDTSVTELFIEAAVPVYVGEGLVQSFDLDLGYRLSDYRDSGNENTWKIGFIADAGMVRVRGGYNKAIRAPSINNLFNPQRTALFGGSDPCAGANPTFTQAQCANTGVSAAQYGNVPANPADQNNQFIGGNPNVQPEDAETWTLGFVVTPIENLQVTLDYYDIFIEDTIAAIGASTILEFCALTGDPFLCDRIQRGPTGDIWLSSDNFVRNTTDNFGELSARGVDVGVNYSFDALGGRFAASFNGNYNLETEFAPLPGVNEDATFDCAGIIDPNCGATQPDWRHIASLRYSRDAYALSLRWRHIGGLDYESSTNGSTLTADRLLCAEGTPVTSGAPCRGNGGIGSYNYIDLAGSYSFGQYTEFTLGINNIFDKSPPITGASLALNGNSPGGYDQLGRFIFSSVSVKF